MREGACPFALLLHRLPQFAGTGFRRLLPLQSFFGCLRSQRGLGLDVPPCYRKILLEPRGPLALMLQRCLQLRPATRLCLFQPGRFFTCFRRQYGLGFDFAPSSRKILRQPLGPIVLQLQTLQQLDIAPRHGEFAG